MGAQLGGDALRRGSGGGVESRTFSILTISTRAMGMGFAYGLGGSGKVAILVFLLRPVFGFCIFRFKGRGQILKIHRLPPLPCAYGLPYSVFLSTAHFEKTAGD